MAKQISLDEYLNAFPQECRVEAFQCAIDTRKFEIELYWKRAAYFWIFIAGTFAVYFIIQKQMDISDTYIVACLGFLFSFIVVFCKSRKRCLEKELGTPCGPSGGRNHRATVQDSSQSRCLPVLAPGWAVFVFGAEN
jgi:hypothetical protein